MISFLEDMGLVLKRSRLIVGAHCHDWQVLVERTLAEVAGTMLTAELALKHGIACNTAGGALHSASAMTATWEHVLYSGGED